MTAVIAAPAVKTTVSGGIGVSIKKTANDYQVNGENADPLQPSGLYVPTLRQIVDYAIFQQANSATDTSWLRLAEVNLDAAATAASDTNCMALVLRGINGGSQELRLNSTSRHFAYNATRQTVASQPTSGGTDYTGPVRGYATLLTATADMAITSAAFMVATSGFGFIDGTGLSVVYELLSADRQTVLGTTGIFNDGVSQDGIMGNPRSFGSVVHIAQGTSFWLVNRAAKPGLGSTAGPTWCTNTIAPGGAVTHVAAATSVLIANGGTAPKIDPPTFDKQSASAGLAGYDVHAQPQYQQYDGLSGYDYPVFALYGTGSGVLLSGDIHVDLKQYGTGGTPGAGANVRLSFGSSAVGT